MPRKLKTFITDLGFFQLAVAAPSMKAALDAWGLKHNAFHQGFAKETNDPKIIAAAEASPGLVLQRPIGARGEFKKKTELPTVKPSKKTKKVKPKTDKAAVRKATDALASATARHQKAASALRDQRNKLDKRIEEEDSEWQREREKLEKALRRLER